MKKFSYIAIDNRENIIRGTVDMEDRANVISALRKQSFRPISVKESTQKKRHNKHWLFEQEEH